MKFLHIDYIVAYKRPSVHDLVLHRRGAVDRELELRLLGLAALPRVLPLLSERGIEITWVNMATLLALRQTHTKRAPLQRLQLAWPRVYWTVRCVRSLREKRSAEIQRSLVRNLCLARGEKRDNCACAK